MGKNLLKDLLIQGLHYYLILMHSVTSFFFQFKNFISQREKINILGSCYFLFLYITLNFYQKRPRRLSSLFLPRSFLHYSSLINNSQNFFESATFCRGYYRCSTSKGCSAKKQVERCRTDASMLIVTYTSSHNHPGPNLSDTNLIRSPKEPQNLSTDQYLPESPTQEQQEKEKQNEPPTMTTKEKDPGENHFQYIQSPISSSQDIIANQGEDPFTVHLERSHETMGLLLDEEPLCYSQLMTFSTDISEENDFFDELEELPTYSSFTSFMRTNFSDERIPAVPS